MNIKLEDIQKDISRAVRIAIEEDIGSGDITAQLIPQESTSRAEIVTREDCVLCGQAWLNETYMQLGGVSKIEWRADDGDFVTAGTTLVTIEGNSRTLLSGERIALNFLQLLSGIATKAQNYVNLVQDTEIKILDTRKTLPGLRTAQKYAVATGGCDNHRIGLFDAYLIKENHIAACGGIQQAVETARINEPGKPVEVEVENIDELKLAISAGADIIMLDNFDLDLVREAEKYKTERVKYEVSGNISIATVEKYKKTAIDYISTGDLTKNNLAVDLSMLIATATSS